MSYSSKRGTQSRRIGIVMMVAIATTMSLLLSVTAQAQADAENGNLRTGNIKGNVVDKETLAPLMSANVSLVGTERGAISKRDGSFVIKDVPVGTYVVRFSYLGYETVSKTDVVVRSGRDSFTDAAMTISPIKVEGVVVKTGYFAETEDQPGSAIGFSSEEVRRSPGTAGDVSRIVASLPSIAKINDQMNSLIVRGGTPTENGFYLDNIEIPNINHYPMEGTSGGPIGLVNVDFIKDVDFSAGGFSAEYGDRLSSIMDLEFREGNRESFDAEIDLHFAGVGGTAEGPLAGGRGSWMFAARRSYLDLLVDAIGTGVAPKYSDYQGKVVYDLSPSNRISLLGVSGVDFIEFKREDSQDEGNSVYGTHKGYEYAVGANWRYLWSKNGYSNTSISTLGTKYKGAFYETTTERQLTDQNTLEEIVQLRNVNTYRINNSNSVQFGVEGKLYLSDYNYWMAEYTNSIGDTTAPIQVNEKMDSPKGGVFVSYTLRPVAPLSTTFGARYDYFDFNRHSHVAPRFAFSYRVSDRVTIHGASGIYFQNLPLGLLSQREEFHDLKDPQSIHYLLGFSHLMSQNTKLTVEGYYKDYRNFPVDPEQPGLFVADELVYRGFFGVKEALRDDGVARSYGVEVTVQKKLVEGVYGLLSGAISKAEYKSADGIWRDRVFDNGLLCSAEGGYKPNDAWEFSMRWIYAGGAPYTPLDIEASKAINRSVLDRNRINEERYPAYHSLNVRVDRRFNFSQSNLIVFLSVWNAYNRENIAGYYWNEIDREQDVMHQWSMLPVFGMEFEF